MRRRYGSLSVRPASTRSRAPAARPRSVVGLALAGLLGPAAAADDALSLRMAPELGAAGPAQEVRGADLGLGARGLHWQILESRYRLRRRRGETEQLRGRLARHADTVAGLRALDRARDDAPPAAPSAATGPPRLRLVDAFSDVPAQQTAAPAASPGRSSGADAGTPSAHLRTVKIDAPPRGVGDGDGVDEVFAAADALLSAAPRPAGAAGPGKTGNPASAAPGATPSTTRPKRPA